MEIIAIAMSTVCILCVIWHRWEIKKLKMEILIVSRCEDAGMRTRAYLKEVGYDITARGLVKIRPSGKQESKQ